MALGRQVGRFLPPAVLCGGHVGGQLLCQTDPPRHPERCSNTSQRSRHAAARLKAARYGWQRLVWHAWDALPASKDQRGTATAPAVPISVPDRPPTTTD